MTLTCPPLHRNRLEMQKVFAFLCVVLALCLHSKVVYPASEAFVSLVNKERQWENKPAHRLNPRLARVAAGLAIRLAERGPGAFRQRWVAQELDAAGYRTRLPSMVQGYNYPSAEAFLTAIRTGEMGQRILNSDVALDLAIARQETDRRLRNQGISEIWVAFAALPDRPAPATWRVEVLELVNRFRRQHALPDLVLNDELNRAAQAHAEDMAVHDYFAHRSPRGSSPGMRAERHGYAYQLVLENLAAGMSAPEEVVEGWKASKDGHREAMLDPRPVEVGIGYQYHPTDKGRALYFHYWAMTMGQPRG